MLAGCFSWNLHSQTTKVVERGPHHRVVEIYWQTTNQIGETITLTNDYTVLGDGMHYWDNDQWNESKELIEPFPEGAVARQGPLKVIFSPNLNSAGAIDISGPDNNRLVNHVVGIYYTDMESGQSVLIGQVQDSTAQIIPPNQLVYPDAFQGDAKGDMLYTYKKAGLEADVVLTQLPTLPDGFDPAHALLEVVTEFLEPPEPAITENLVYKERDPEIRDQMAMPDLKDRTLSFGHMALSYGKAFRAGGEAENAKPVAKDWVNISGRQLLIESVRYEDIQDQIEDLLTASSTVRSNKLIAKTRFLPSVDDSKSDYPIRQIVSYEHAPNSFIVDYDCISSSTTFEFESGKTYCLESDVTISDSTIFRANTVIKYATGAELTLSGIVTCPPSSGLPAYFTAKHDHSIGTVIEFDETTEYTLITNPQYYSTSALHLYYLDSQIIHDLQIRYAQRAIVDHSPYSEHTFRDNHLIFCQDGVSAYYTDVTVTNLTVCDVVNNTVNLGSSAITVNNVKTRCNRLVNNPVGDSGNDADERAQVESSLEVFGNNILVAFNDRNSDDGGADKTTGLAHSTDGGDTFQDLGVLPDSTKGDGGDPVVAVADDGNMYIVTIAKGLDDELAFFKTTDYGSTVSYLGDSAGNYFNPGNKLDKPWLTIDRYEGYGNGTLYQVFQNTQLDTGGERLRGFYFTRSTDAGINWNGGASGGAHFFEQFDPNGDQMIGNVVVAPDHKVFVFYYKAGDRTAQKIKGRHSGDLGYSWPEANELPTINLNSTVDTPEQYFLNILDEGGNQIRNICGPQAAVNPVNGDIYLVYPDDPAGADASDIYLSRYYYSWGDRRNVFLRNAAGFLFPVKEQNIRFAKIEW